jgi:hypothetical protein
MAALAITTQAPTDRPDAYLGQFGNREQHGCVLQGM